MCCTMYVASDCAELGRRASSSSVGGTLAVSSAPGMLSLTFFVDGCGASAALVASMLSRLLAFLVYIRELLLAGLFQLHVPS